LTPRNTQDKGLPSGTVTFLFSDIESSTELLKRLGGGYAGLLAEHRRILRAAFERWGGKEVDTQGDAFFYSFPRASSAVAAAVDAQRALAARAWPGGVEVRVRMGLHTGEPLVEDEGYVGMDVHRAARVAHAGHGGQVLLSETTTSLVRDELPEGAELQDLGRHRLKDMPTAERISQLVIEGLASEFPALQSMEALPPEFPLGFGQMQGPAFLGEKGQPDRPRSIFVGRDRELDRLQALLDRAMQGEGGLAFVIGDPGCGKTTLMDEFAGHAMDANPELLVARGSCSAYTGAGDPYLPFRMVMAMLTGDVEEKWRGGVMTRNHALRLWKAMPENAQILEEYGRDLIGVFLSGSGLLRRIRAAFEGGASWLERLAKLSDSRQVPSAEVAQANLFEQYEAVLSNIAQTHPLILALDDLQWADAASINLLFHLGRHLQGSRILILGSYRPEEVSLGRGGEKHPLERPMSEFKRQYGDIWIDLGDQSRYEERQFIDALLDSEPNRLSGDFRNALFEHTAGHPLFTVELLRSLQERGDLERDERGNWIERPGLDWGVLPARVEGVIEDRIGRLEEDLHEALRIASVEGEDFTAQVVARVQVIGERRLLHMLSGDLEKRHRLVHEGASIELDRITLHQYQFSHHLFQQFLYNDLGSGERQLLHSEIAEALEELYAEHAPSIAVRLAHHYSRARRSERASRYYELAGDLAWRSYAWEEALRHYQDAIDHAPAEEIARRADLYSRSGEVRTRMGEFESALEAFTIAGELYARMEDVHGHGMMENKIGWTYWAMGKREESLEHYQRAYLNLAETGETAGLAYVMSQISRIHMVAAEHDKAIAWGEKALEIASHLEAGREIAEVLTNLGISHSETGDLERGLSELRESVAISQDLSVRTCVRAYNNLANELKCTGRYAEARQTLNRLQQYAAERKDEISASLASLWLCEIEWKEGNWAIAQASRGLILDKLTGIYRVWGGIVFGHMDIDMGQAERGRAELEQQYLVALSSEEIQTSVQLLGELARSYAALGMVSKARSTLREMLRRIDRSRYFDSDSITYLLFAVQWFARLAEPISIPECQQSVVRQRRAHRQLGLPASGACLAEGEGVLALAQNQMEAAISHFLVAVEAWNRLGHVYDEMRARASLGRAYAAKGDARSALVLYHRAWALAERLAAELTDEDAKMSFMKTGLVSEIQSHLDRRGSDASL
jgi:class 3 adenylate cyclase/tetratricopeptide (TPR) repeat protein